MYQGFCVTPPQFIFVLIQPFSATGTSFVAAHALPSDLPLQDLKWLPLESTSRPTIRSTTNRPLAFPYSCSLHNILAILCNTASPCYYFSFWATPLTPPILCENSATLPTTVAKTYNITRLC